MPGYKHRAQKYAAKPTVVDDIRFDSKKEAKRYQELKLLERAGAIVDLKLQPSFNFTTPIGPLRYTESNRVVIYRADFSYVDVEKQVKIVEDVKGYDTPLSKLKRAMMVGLNGIYVILI